MAATLRVGAPAPPFRLKAHDGSTVSLAALKGKVVVLYFYPEDDTDVCTAQACSVRDAWDDLAATGAVVLGVSPDGVASHAAFRKKYGLPFTLLADEDHDVATRYGAWGPKTLYGNTYVGMHRNAVLIARDGTIAQVFPNVRSKGFGARMAAAVKKL
ncbi:MAG TPA: thioredoxin-dependent thiol peroxidase [Gemmatimonadales bacterium]|nr:thioredoxin-dependent thiol peroxidase [Gemmatimonadales bacterium]